MLIKCGHCPFSYRVLMLKQSRITVSNGIHYLDSKWSDLAFAFTPGIFDAFSLSSLRSESCPPEQNLHVHIWRTANQQLTPLKKKITVVMLPCAFHRNSNDIYSCFYFILYYIYFLSYLCYTVRFILHGAHDAWVSLATWLIFRRINSAAIKITSKVLKFRLVMWFEIMMWDLIVVIRWVFF